MVMETMVVKRSHALQSKNTHERTHNSTKRARVAQISCTTHTHMRTGKKTALMRRPQAQGKKNMERRHTPTFQVARNGHRKGTACTMKCKTLNEAEPSRCKNHGGRIKRRWHTTTSR
jgi:hypothetical protein